MTQCDPPLKNPGYAPAVGGFTVRCTRDWLEVTTWKIKLIKFVSDLSFSAGFMKLPSVLAPSIDCMCDYCAESSLSTTLRGFC